MDLDKLLKWLRVVVSSRVGFVLDGVLIACALLVALTTRSDLGRVLSWVMVGLFAAAAALRAINAVLLRRKARIEASAVAAAESGHVQTVDE